MPAGTASRLHKHELGQSNLHAEGDFERRIDGLNIAPRLYKLLRAY